ncbi:cell surface A33 antigen-like [Genypterus blacodes]|uniref:cell surface A33 antigen-like n=1 Tax=Genypterus blacodes TaxID=154954 RepID=UPI003F76AA06
MTKDHQLGFQKLFWILTVLPCCGSLQVSIPVKNYEVNSGGDITLTCLFTPAKPEISLMVITWVAEAIEPNTGTETVATYFSERQVDIAPAYEGRASLSVDVDKRESSLRLTKVTVNDNRIYQCTILIPNDDEGTTTATTSLMVLDPPSTPICKLQGTAEYGNNINLTCVSEIGMPKPDYEWRAFSVQHAPREFPPKATEKNGLLSFVNVSHETSGYYICTSANRLGSASCNFTLAVMPPSMNIGATAGIIVGVLAGVVCLGVIFYCCCYKKKKQDKYAEGSPEAVEFHDSETPKEREQDGDKPNNLTDKYTDEVNQHEEKAVPHQNDYKEERGTSGRKVEDDQHSYEGGKGRQDDKGSDRNRGSRDRLADQRDQYRGSRDRLDDHGDRHSGSRDRLNDPRDRLNDPRDRNGGSRDRLDDHRDRHGGSRDRLDDRRDRHGGSRDRLDDNDQHRDQYR